MIHRKKYLVNVSQIIIESHLFHTIEEDAKQLRNNEKSKMYRSRSKEAPLSVC